MRSLFLVLLVGCGGGSLDRADVEHIPPGDGLGSALTGDWTLTLRVTGCNGDCVSGEGESMQTACAVIDTPLTSDVQVVQSDGVLQLLEVDGSPYLAGGIDADGGFQLGAYQMTEGTEHMILFSGNSSPSSMSGTMEARLKGADLDCTAVADASMTRR